MPTNDPGETHYPLHLRFLRKWVRQLLCVHTHTYTQVSCGWMVHSKTNGNLNLSAALHEASASEGCVEVRATLAQPAETSSIIGQIAANFYRVSVGGYDQPIEHFKNGNQEVL